MNTGTINLTPSEASAFEAVWKMVNSLDARIRQALKNKLNASDAPLDSTKSTAIVSKLDSAKSHKYYISPEVRALEFGDKYSKGLSDDYKKEIGDIRAKRYL